MLDDLFLRYPCLSDARRDIEAALGLLSSAFAAGGKLLVCGNGGSAADSGHIAGELMKSFCLRRPLPVQERETLAREFGDDGAALASKLEGSLPVIALPDQTATLTAFSNDAAADAAFAQLVYGYARSDDVLLCISTSGNSLNVVNAARVAKLKGIPVISLTGRDACRLDALSAVTIHAPAVGAAPVQELHLPIYHALCRAVEEQIWG